MEQRKREVLEEAEVELEAVFQHTKSLPEEKVAQVCGPLLAAHRRTQFKRAALFLAAAAAVFLIVFYSEMAQLHLTAVIRIALVKVLPWWEWRPLHRQRCLIQNLHFLPPPAFSVDDCVSCEAVDQVDRVADTTYQHLLDNYLQRNAPVVVVDAMDNWPTMRSNFWIQNVTQLYLQDEKLKKTRPCSLTSNILRGSGSNSDLTTLLAKIQNPELTKWFAHWLNCELAAMKTLRQFYQRPYFLAASVAPAHYNWLLLSSKYKATLYKKLKLESGLILLYQMRGSNSLKLYPLVHCEGICSEITVKIYEGEILLFLNFLWDFEYLPGRDAENIAILTETAWDSFSVY